MFSSFSEKSRKIITSAKEEMIMLKHPYIGSEHLLLALLKNKNDVKSKLNDLEITYELVRSEIENIVGFGTSESNLFIYTPLLKRIIETACINAKEGGSDVLPCHLFEAMLEEGEGVAIRIMIGMNIDIDNLYDEFSFKILNSAKNSKPSKSVLSELGEDITEKAFNNKVDPVYGREDEIRRIIEILSRRSKNNPVLIGEAGVGKTALVEELARKIVLNEVPVCLQNKKIISLDMSSLVAGTKYRGEFEEKINKVLKEVESDDDVILFIDEIHTLVGAGGAEGAIDASNIFKPSLARGKLRCIGATTTSEYTKYIEEDSALERRFQKVSVLEPSFDTVTSILLKIKPIYESFHHVCVDDSIIKKIVSLSSRYIFDRNEPDRSIDVLDEVCAKVSLKETRDAKKHGEYIKLLNLKTSEKKLLIKSNQFSSAIKVKDEENVLISKINNIELSMKKSKNKCVCLKDVAEVISQKTKIPVYEIINKNNNFSKLESDIRGEIVGQSEVCEKMVKLVKKIKLGLVDDNKCHSVLFTGPSGVGKTFLAKLVGGYMSKSVIKLDMSEYRESCSISKILGPPPGYVGYKESKNILESVRNNPYSVLILDEIEKAHPSILELFYQIFDDSKIKNSDGRDVYFNNVLIIMTSNVGFDDIKVGFSKCESLGSKLNSDFSIPFINRVDSIIGFSSLSFSDIEIITRRRLKKLKNKYRDKDINLIFSKELINDIVSSSDYKVYGARRVDKIIKTLVEDVILEDILAGKKIINISSLKRVEC